MTSKDTPQTPADTEDGLMALFDDVKDQSYLYFRKKLLAWRDHTQAQPYDEKKVRQFLVELNADDMYLDKTVEITATDGCNGAMRQAQATDLAAQDPDAMMDVSNPPEIATGYVVMTPAPSSREEELERFVNAFIEKWCEPNVAHLLDNDENDGEFLRQNLAAWHTQQVEAAMEQADIRAEIRGKRLALEKMRVGAGEFHDDPHEYVVPLRHIKEYEAELATFDLSDPNPIFRDKLATPPQKENQ